MVQKRESSTVWMDSCESWIVCMGGRESWIVSMGRIAVGRAVLMSALTGRVGGRNLPATYETFHGRGQR